MGAHFDQECGGQSGQVTLQQIADIQPISALPLRTEQSTVLRMTSDVGLQTMFILFALAFVYQRIQ